MTPPSSRPVNGAASPPASTTPASSPALVASSVHSALVTHPGAASLPGPPSMGSSASPAGATRSSTVNASIARASRRVVASLSSAGASARVRSVIPPTSWHAPSARLAPRSVNETAPMRLMMASSPRPRELEARSAPGHGRRNVHSNCGRRGHGPGRGARQYEGGAHHEPDDPHADADIGEVRESLRVVVEVDPALRLARAAAARRVALVSLLEGFDAEGRAHTQRGQPDGAHDEAGH